jgi:predicted nucleic acid-binding protein
MATTPTNAKRVIVDACIAIAVCSLEPTAPKIAKYISEKDAQGYEFYAPGAFVAEVLFVLCKKTHETPPRLTQPDYDKAILLFDAFCKRLRLTSTGDYALIKRAVALRAGLVCNRTTDAIYIALAEEIAASEIVTTDPGMKAQAMAAGSSAHVEVIS